MESCLLKDAVGKIRQVEPFSLWPVFSLHQRLHKTGEQKNVDQGDDSAGKSASYASMRASVQILGTPVKSQYN